MRYLRALPRKPVQLFLAMTLLAGLAAAKRRSDIHGVVTTLGPDGAPVYLPGVQITLRYEMVADNAGTTFTDESGRFSFVDLAPGRCRATATMEGFRSETKTVFVLENSTVDLSFQLELERVAERRRKP